MSGTMTSTQALRYTFGLLITLTVIGIMCGSIVSFISSIYVHTHTDTEYHEFNQRLPKCIIIGAMKSGTKALIEFLGMHPHIKINRKDVDFFNKDENYSQGIEYYRQLMPYSYPGDVTIEKSPAYFASEDARKRIRLFNKNIKLIIILRNPITRSMSHFLQLKRKHAIDVDKFEDYLIDSATGNFSVSGMSILEPSMYVDHITQWFLYFRRNQFHIVDGESFIHNPILQLRKLETFLGLKHWISDIDVYFDNDKGFYCMQEAKNNENCLQNNKGNKHPEIEPKVREKLQDFFKSYNRQLSELLGWDFDWN